MNTASGGWDIVRLRRDAKRRAGDGDDVSGVIALKAVRRSANRAAVVSRR